MKALAWVIFVHVVGPFKSHLNLMDKHHNQFQVKIPIIKLSCALEIFSVICIIFPLGNQVDPMKLIFIPTMKKRRCQINLVTTTLITLRQSVGHFITC